MLSNHILSATLLYGFHVTAREITPPLICIINDATDVATML